MSTKEEDRKKGEQAIKHFYNESKRLHAENMRVSYTELIDLIDMKSNHYITGLGMGINMVEISDTNVEDAMNSLARNSMGKLPNDLQVFTQAIINRESEFDWKAFSEISKDTLEDTLVATQALGKDLGAGVKGVGTLFSKSKYVLPVIGVVALYFFIKTNSLSGIIKAVKGKK